MLADMVLSVSGTTVASGPLSVDPPVCLSAISLNGANPLTNVRVWLPILVFPNASEPILEYGQPGDGNGVGFRVYNVILVAR